MVYDDKNILIFDHWLGQINVVAFRFINELLVKVFIYAK